MAFDTAEKEIDILDKLRKSREDLINRMDLTYSKFRGDKFKIDAKEGKWESVTSTKAQSEGWKIINILELGKVSLSISAEGSNEAKRDKYTKTEKLVNGLIYSGDRRLDGIPELNSIHSQKVFYTVVRGWLTERLLVLSDDDNKPYLNLVFWDPRNVFYIPGRNGITKVYASRLLTEEQAKEEYKGFNGKVNQTNGLVEIVDVWGLSGERDNIKAQEAIICSGEYVKEPEDVKVGGKFIDYLPIRIKAGGAIPMINDNNTDNIAHVGEDYLVNNRDLPDLLSRLLSYCLTRAGMEAKMPTVISYKGTPPDLGKDPYVKGSFILLDKTFEQEVAPPLPMALGDKINFMINSVLQAWREGGLGEIAYGISGGSETAFATDVLNKNTREHVASFKKLIEQSYEWEAREIVKQYKLGGYKESKFTGYTSKFERFDAENIRIEEITDEREFKCNLILETLADRATHSGMAIQELKAGLLSHRTVLDQHQIVTDPDQELKIIEQEKFNNSVDMPIVKGAAEQIKDYMGSKNDAEKAFILEHTMKILQKIEEQYQPQPEQPQGADQLVGKSPQLTAANKRLTARTPQNNIPAPVREAVINSEAQNAR